MDGEWMLQRLLPEAGADLRQKLLKAQGDSYRADFIHQAQPFEAVHELFEELKGRGVKIGIATTCKGDELAIYDQRLKVVELADAIVCGEAVEHGKPDPALLADCLRSLGIDTPANTVNVGDTPFDAMAGKALGLCSAAVLTGGFSAAALRESGHDYVFEAVRQISSLAELDVQQTVEIAG